MICRLSVDLLSSGLWYPLVRKTEHHKKRRVFVMKKNLTELVFILDRSGSMGGAVWLREDPPDDRAGKRTVRLGISVPWSQHGRRAGGRPLRHRGRPGGAVRERCAGAFPQRQALVKTPGAIHPGCQCRHRRSFRTGAQRFLRYAKAYSCRRLRSDLRGQHPRQPPRYPC